MKSNLHLKNLVLLPDTMLRILLKNDEISSFTTTIVNLWIYDSEEKENPK